MKKNRKLNRSALIIFILLASVFVFTKCVDNKSDKKLLVADSTFDSFAGNGKCKSCHQSIYEAHIKTGHFNTSALATEKNILGSFKKDSNLYHFTPQLFIAMEKKENGFYQDIYFKESLKKELKFDYVTGSGTKGQTYIYRSGNKLFQMPISYFTPAHQWVNSPGFLPTRVTYDKPITARCLECHSTFATVISDANASQEEYDYSKMLLGIGCEKCHGPAAKHVSYQTNNSTAKEAKFIINPAKLNRQQQLDLCVLCHGGNLQKTTNSFSFTAGKYLADYFKIDTSTSVKINKDQIDVHGNQFGLLKTSKCFKMSSSMTCNTCHGSHENERGNLELFSQRCMSCHNSGHNNFCTFKKEGVDKAKNCISCHMPLTTSMSVTMNIQNADIPTVAKLRTHYISIDRDATIKFLSGNK